MMLEPKTLLILQENFVKPIKILTESEVKNSI